MIARILRPVFTVRRSLLVLGVAVGGLAFPAASMAATYTVNTTPIHKGSKGFMLRLSILQGMPTGYGGRYPNSVAGILNKKSDGGHASETDNYAFSGAKGHSLKFTTGKKALQFAKITGTFANGDGSINMTFHATGKAVHVKVPKGCQTDTGARSGTKRSGMLRGSYTLKAGKLGTVTQKSFKATISNVGWTCSPSSHGYDVDTGTSGNPFVDVFKGPKGKVTETISDQSSGKGWIFTHAFIVRDQPSSDYKIETTKNLKGASVKGAGGITGTATYSSSHSSSHKTTGKMSGSLAVTMASIGKVTAFPKARSATQTHS